LQGKVSVTRIRGKSISDRNGNIVFKKAPHQWKAYGRELKVVDGSTVIMPDTERNQEKFPQHSGQKKGLGFPMARIVVVMSLTLGTVLNYAVDAYQGKGTGEHTLLRRILGSIEADDIVLGDSYFPSFFLLAELQSKGADGMLRLI
jgi:hypothetical protein